MRIALFALALLTASLLSSCPGGKKAGDAADAQAGNGNADLIPSHEDADAAAIVEPAVRGKEIFEGTEYSNTGMTCAHCHAATPEQEAAQKFIAHTAYGSATRGAWKITTQEQYDAKKGYAATLADAANACIGAPYMNHKDQLLTEADGAALTAYLESISKPDAWDAAAFIIAKGDALPVAGLKPDKAHGKQLYELSCKQCHDAGIEGMPELTDVKDWLTPTQVMAKLRKLPDWYNGYQDKTYAAAHRADLLALLPLVGVTRASAEENPCNPCGGEAEHSEHSEHGEHAEHGEGEMIFAENAMPFYGTDILSDQDVVDVSYYVAEDR